MTKRNKPVDVFKYIDMKGGDREQCWPWLGGCNKEGRPLFSLNKKKVAPYRITYELTHGVSLPSTIMLRHKCDNMICCNPYHGEPGTHIDNMLDMRERERHGLPKITVKAIRKLLSEGEEHESIAKKFGVDRNTVGRIARGETYAEIPDRARDGEVDSDDTS